MKNNWRINLLFLVFLVFSLSIIYRLFYWQVLSQKPLSDLARQQHWTSLEIPANRGKILANDNFPLVDNQNSYLLYASVPEIKDSTSKISRQLATILIENKKDQESWQKTIEERLRRTDLVWSVIQHRLSAKEKGQVSQLNISGLGFENEPQRFYPEGSSSAHLLGFLGQDKNGNNQGYFGLEGYYDLQLKGQPGLLKREKAASGQPILIGQTKVEKSRPGHDLVTTIDRPIQYIVSQKLQQALFNYGAKAGTVIVMEPKSGAILAMAAYPNYDAATYWQSDPSLYPNPAIAFTYEPGSTFKVLVMSAALNEKIVGPEVVCDQCSGPIQIDKYTIKTWNEKYFPNETMTEIIQHSDNVGMVFVAQKLGINLLFDYLNRFGLNDKTGIDLQEEAIAGLRPKKNWGPVELATAAFGQGIAVTPIQMIRAVGVIANQGKIVKPFVVRKIISDKGINETKIESGQEVISPTTARQMTEMMVNAVENGEAKWAKPKGYLIAGKTGTAQIPISGHYDQEKTIASFVGFAPVDDPKFVMLVTLREPTSSPWGSETAAPLWFSIAKDLFLYYGILPG